MTKCDLCRDTGFVLYTKNGYEYAAVCACEVGNRIEPYESKERIDRYGKRKQLLLMEIDPNLLNINLQKSKA